LGERASEEGAAAWHRRLAGAHQRDAAVRPIRTGGTPQFEAKDQALAYRLVTELIDTKRLSDRSFADAITAFGEKGLVELGTIIGYYTAIGNALNVFQVGLPAGQAPYFPET